MKKSLTLITLLCMVVFAQQGSFTDSRDGKKYKTVKIGNQTWMAENLNYNAKGSKCYDNKEANCTKYGRLYDWATAMNLPGDCNSNDCWEREQIQEDRHQGICPQGWLLPSDEWRELLKEIGGDEFDDAKGIVGKKLKAKSGWNNKGNGTDEYGFAALPGSGSSGSGVNSGLGYAAAWWDISENGADRATSWEIYCCNNEDAAVSSYVLYNGGSEKSSFFSVRCVKEDLAKTLEMPK